ncbi:MAG: glutamate dehydrogenase [Promethearchaeota archaeon Loki_b32]|nr:MAG: glutamate dehydrogenase [Candidatus Lokiarchaeota archaeon Loki_b32]
MIPKKMKSFLHERLPEATLKTRLKKDNGKCYLEFSNIDEHLLSRIGIVVDKLGPHLVACLWDETSELEIGGYLVVDNLSMGSPSMGGIRMLPDIVPSDIHNLARGMTLKNAAANLPYGGGKSGIVAERDLSLEEHDKVIGGFARLIKRYSNIYLPGPDVGTNDADMKTIAIENGIDSVLSKPADMGGNRIDELGAAAGGVVIALQTLLEIMPRLRVLPQFVNLEIPETKDLKILIQGFGAVGAHAARILYERIPDAKVIGVSDLEGYLYNESGLPIRELFKIWEEKRLVTNIFFKEKIFSEGYKHPTKFSTNRNNLLLENAFCLVPAAPIFNYLGVRASENPSITVDRMGKWVVIIEGANTYSPDPNRKAARTRMEQIVYGEKGVMIANDYLVNSGGVIFAAQEHIIKSPDQLQIPEEILGDRKAVEKWLKGYSKEFIELSKQRLKAGEEYREDVIHRNMSELVDLLAAHPDMLPCTAAERISLQRLTVKERERTAKDIMIPIPTIDVKSKIQEAAALMIQNKSGIIAVLSENKLVGVVTDWDITAAVASNSCDVILDKVITKDVVIASPDFSIIDIVRELEQYQISAMPVVEQGKVLGMVNSDLIAQRYILEYLQSH